MIGDHVKIIINNFYDGVYFVDRNRRVTFWNLAAERITGYKSEEVLGLRCGENILMHINEQGHNLCTVHCPIAKTIADGQMREEKMYFQHKDGHRVPVSVRTVAVRDALGQISGAAEIFTDETTKLAVLERIEELRKMVFLDPLTGLSNKRFIEKDLRAKLDEMERFGWTFGVMIMAVDHLGKINQEHGIDTGDRVLKMVAKTMLGNSRSFDNVGRWDGGEFIALISNVDKGKLSLAAERFRMLVEKSSLMVDSNLLQVTLSIGATIARPEDSIESLIKRAEELMFQSKASGHNCVTQD